MENSQKDHAYMHQHGIPHSHNHVHENQKAVVNRLARALGHLEKVKKMVEEGRKVCTLGPIIHNPQVIEDLDKKGVKIISDNPRYEPMFANAEDDSFKVIGKVRSVMHNM